MIQRVYVKLIRHCNDCPNYLWMAKVVKKKYLKIGVVHCSQWGWQLGKDITANHKVQVPKKCPLTKVAG